MARGLVGIAALGSRALLEFRRWPLDVRPAGWLIVVNAGRRSTTPANATILGATTMQMQIKAIEFDSAHEAIQHCDAEGLGKAILVQGKALVVLEEEADRLAAAGVEFAYLFGHRMPDGSNRIVTVPVN